MSLLTNIVFGFNSRGPATSPPPPTFATPAPNPAPTPVPPPTPAPTPLSAAATTTGDNDAVALPAKQPTRLDADAQISTPDLVLDTPIMRPIANATATASAAPIVSAFRPEVSNAGSVQELRLPEFKAVRLQSKAPQPVATATLLVSQAVPSEAQGRVEIGFTQNRKDLATSEPAVDLTSVYEKAFIRLMVEQGLSARERLVRSL